jgi:HlyD family secretion protein
VRQLVLALVMLAACTDRGEVRYRFAKVERGPIEAVLVASGTLNAVTSIQLRAQIAGEIKELYADFNTPVKKGEVIARLDATSFEQRVAQARADLDAARLAGAAATAKRGAALLRQAQADLERTVIRAPVDGTVILRNAEVGQSVAAGAQAPVLFAIAESLHEMQIEAPLDPNESARVRSRMAVHFVVDALPRRRFSGEVRQVRKAAVVISAPNADLVLLPGMTAHLRIVTERRASVLKVPNAALDRAGARVWVLEAGKPKAVAVRLGVSDGTSTELVQSPLAEGTQVIVGSL